MFRTSYKNCNIYNYRTLVEGNHVLLQVIKVERKRENAKLFFLPYLQLKGSEKSSSHFKEPGLNPSLR